MTGITLALFSCLALEVDQNNFSVKILIVCRIGLPLPRNMIGLPLPRNMIGLPLPRNMIGLPLPRNMIGLPLSRNMIGLPLSRNMIGLENSCHPLNQSDGTPRIRHTLACVFSRFWQFACFYLEFLLALCTGQSL